MPYKFNPFTSNLDYYTNGTGGGGTGSFLPLAGGTMTGTIVSNSPNRAILINGTSNASVDVVNINDAGTGAGLKVISTGGTGGNAGVFRNQGFAVDTVVHIQRTLMDVSQPSADQAVLKVQKDNSNANDIGNLIGINNFNTNSQSNCLYIEQHGGGPMIRTNDGTYVIFDIDSNGNWMGARSGTGDGRSLTFKSPGGLIGGTDNAGGNLILSSGISTGSQSSQIQFLIPRGGASGTVDRNPGTALILSQIINGEIELQAGQSTGSGNIFLFQGQHTTASDTTGGELRLASGQGRGTGDSFISLYTSTSGASGNTVNSATEKVRINGSGNVGIGTTAPSYTLDVNGTIRAQQVFGVSIARTFAFMGA